MIFVDRNQVAFVPTDWPGRKEAELRISEFYGRIAEGPMQSRLDFEKFINRFYRAMRPAVTELFHNKCAYCESPLGATGAGDMELFRPKQAASQISGEGSIAHYGWLSIVWDNLYIACRICNSSKKNLFPVEGERAPLLAPLSSVRSFENASLIDPCWNDPNEHLAFHDDGKLRALSAQGEVSISILKLNRDALIAERARVVAALAQALRERARPTASLVATLSRALAPDAPYLGAARAFVTRHLGELGKLPSRPDLAPRFAWLRLPETPRHEEGPRPRKSSTITQEEMRRLDARPLKQVKIANFKLLRDFTLDFPEPRERTPWLILLGENATGKSAALLATALALAGAKNADRYLKPADILHRDADEGSVRLTFWDSEELAELTFERGKKRFGGTRAASVLVLAYGSLRIPGREGTRGFAGLDPDSHVSGITRPVTRLPNPLPWLRSIDKNKFDAVARVLKSVLMADDRAVVDRPRGRIRFNTASDRASLDELSAGYGAVVAMVVDIMTVVLSRWSEPEAAEGFVIVDELESHLHPKWRMRIVTALRKSMPQVQFMVSTHDPLMLRGAKNGEVRLMRREPAAGAVAIAQLPNIEGLRVDQLLASEHFGLGSTIDPELDASFARYYHLLSITARTPDEEAEIATLREELDGKKVLGGNRRERLMYQAIDTFLARKEPAVESDPALSDLLQSLWDRP